MSHRDYYEGDVRFPSVTEVLSWPPKKWLEEWKQKWGGRAEQKTHAATEIGKQFHELAEYLAVERIPFVRPDWYTKRLDSMLLVFNKWLISNNLRIKEAELHVVSKLYQYQGTFDATGYLHGKKELYIFDWKTSSSIYPDMALQLSAYAQAYYEQTGIRIKKGYIVHVSKDKPDHKLTVKEYTLGKRLFNKFLKRLSEYRYNCEG